MAFVIAEEAGNMCLMFLQRLVALGCTLAVRGGYDRRV